MISHGETEQTTRRVYVIDDDDEFRRSTAFLLEVAGFRVSEFASGLEFLERQRDLSPGVILLDLRMPGISGLNLLESAVIEGLKFATVVLTGHGEIESAVRSLKAGAVDFLEKPFAATDLIHSLETAFATLNMDKSALEERQRAQESVSRLTVREVQVLRGLVGGQPYKVLAHRLGISVRTVEMHRNKLLRKLGVGSTGEAVRFAVYADIEPLE